MEVKLSALEPRFVRYATRELEIGFREVHVPVVDVSQAQGITFLCPVCFEKNGGAVGTHAVHVTFRDRGALPHQGSHGTNGPSRWTVSGAGYDDLTLGPSIDLGPGGCGWHGWIQKGIAT